MSVCADTHLHDHRDQYQQIKMQNVSLFQGLNVCIHMADKVSWEVKQRKAERRNDRMTEPQKWRGKKDVVTLIRGGEEQERSAEQTGVGGRVKESEAAALKNNN